MSNFRSEAESKELHRKILTAATALFIQKGYERTKITDIAKLSGVPKSKILYVMNSKEEILGLLVTRFLDGVTSASDAVSKKLTDDKVLIFIANEVLQLYMAEMNEDMRNLYLSGYSMPKTSEEVLKRRTDMMYDSFSETFKNFTWNDFYETEIASMGIMRAYMTVPCGIYFTIEAKAKRLVTMLLRIYKAEDEKITEAISFIEKIDFATVAKEAVQSVFDELQIHTQNSFPKGEKTMNKTFKKTLSIILTVLMIVTTVPFAFAAADITVTIDTGASVTLKDNDNDGYYDIGTADELYAFAAEVNGGNGSINGELTADIVVNENVLDENGELNGDGSNFREWTPIGLYVDSYDAATVFHGKFNGNNHTVSGLYFNDENQARVGLFGCTNGASIQNVGVFDCYINGYQYVGGVVGFLRTGTLENCYNTGGVLGYDTLGGVAGWAGKSSTIQNCFNTGNVISEKGTTGGVVGYIYCVDVKTTLKNCYSTGNVVLLGEHSVGSSAPGTTRGVIGSVIGGTIENCFFLENTVTIEGKVSNGDRLSGTQAVSFAQFASGEVAHKLGSAFGQILEGENRQSYPVLGGTQVNYGFTTCDEAQTTEIYTNEEAFNTKPAHSGGTATCVAKAVCENCGVEYGDIDEDNHKDTLVQVDAKAKTCTEIGWDAYEYCTACDYSTYVEIPVSHEIKTVDKKDATCTEAGYEAYEYCTECDYTTYKEISSNGHTPLEAVKENEVAPECEKAGSYDLVLYCDVCGEELDRDAVAVDALTHTDADGDYLCDNGCGHEFEKPIDPTPDEPTDGDCDHLCHKDGILGFLWKIISFLQRLFGIQQYCDCGVLHYDAPIFG